MKIVINKCFGGFSLSQEAKKWLKAHNGRVEPEYDYGSTVMNNLMKDYNFDYIADRANPLLVECVETL